MASIQFEKVVKVYDGQKEPVIPDLNLEIKDKEFVILVGPSGCGKSTTLRMIAGLEDITHGTLKIDGKVVNDIPPRDRDIAMVFQSYALYPNMTVYKNIAFPLKTRKFTETDISLREKETIEELGSFGIENPTEYYYKIQKSKKSDIVTDLVNKHSVSVEDANYIYHKAKSRNKFTKIEIDRKVKEVSKILNLNEYLDRKPANLSGGQRQRVALGRAMVRKPKVFLLDEPLSNLDAKLRTELRSQISLLQKRLDTTFVYVTHDQVEAITIADRIAVFNKGVVQQFDTPRELYEHPKNIFVATFIGSPQMNLFKAKVTPASSGLCLIINNQKVLIDTRYEKYKVLNNYVDREVMVGIRPESIVLLTTDNIHSHSRDTQFKVVVKMCEYLGSESYLYFDLGESQMIAKIPPRFALKSGDTHAIALDPNRFYIFDTESEEAIISPTVHHQTV